MSRRAPSCPSLAALLGLCLVACGSVTTTTSHVVGGMVRDATTAKAVVGAAITVSDGGTTHELVSAGDGSFSVPTDGTSGSITVEAEGYVRATQPYNLASTQARIVIALQPASQAAVTPTPLH